MEINQDSVNREDMRNIYPILPKIKNKSGESETKDSNDDINEYAKPFNPSTQRVYLRNQLYAVFAVSMGSLLVGYSFGFVIPTMKRVTNPAFELSWDEVTWFINILPLSALFGSLIGCPLIAYLGRRRTLMASAAPLTTGWICIAISTDTSCLLAGQALCGIGIGIVTFTVPVYVGETIDPKVRGSLGILPTILQGITPILSGLIGNYVNWSLLAFLGSAISLSLFLLMFGIRESPRWFVAKGRSEDASKSLQWFRGKNNNIEKEMEDITRFQDELRKVKGNSCGQLFKIEYMPAVLISFGLIIFQLLSGYEAAIYCSVNFIIRNNIFRPEPTLEVIMGIAQMLSALLAIALIDKIGRVRLLYISSSTMIVSLTLLGIIFHAEESNVDMTPYKWIVIVCLVVYLLGYSIGFGPISWFMIGEILPSKIRGTAAGLNATFYWATNFYYTKTSQDITSTLSTYGKMWLYATICFMGLFFILCFVPETMGKSLEKIEKEMTDNRYRNRRVNNTPV